MLLGWTEVEFFWLLTEKQKLWKNQTEITQYKDYIKLCLMFSSTGKLPEKIEYCWKWHYELI
jgi:hypothetical protein